MLERKDLLGLIDVSKEEITEILDLAHSFKNRIKNGEKKIPHLDGETVTNVIRYTVYAGEAKKKFLAGSRKQEETLA